MEMAVFFDAVWARLDLTSTLQVSHGVGPTVEASHNAAADLALKALADSGVKIGSSPQQQKEAGGGGGGENDRYQISQVQTSFFQSMPAALYRVTHLLADQRSVHWSSTNVCGRPMN